ncbi:hypothetical protein HHK36_005910 [Tetracentron sinense]|uniref:F-box domain-containing protein n=1 Tax=Tetracentron sinense TaxID=13715 RepID=A0A835DNR7_TETSI|nr:hypothetical protein HHK36_005910 [Tetracentron sinense]
MENEESGTSHFGRCRTFDDTDTPDRKSEEEELLSRMDVETMYNGEKERAATWELVSGSSLCFERYASTSVHRAGEVDGLGLDQVPSLGFERRKSNRDFQRKRVKVHSNYRESRYATAMSSGADTSSSPSDGDHITSQLSSVSFENEMILYLTSTHNDGGNGKSMDFNNGNDGDGDGCGISKMEDLEIRMDLTDDLLHMVLSFLDNISLCRAARVCRQWRAASAHEDFWRCLNFKNRNISSLQFADMCHKYPNATEVNIFGAPEVHLLVMKAVSSLRLFFVEKFECIDATFGNGIQEIPVYHDRLRHLEIMKCRVLRISVRCPQLETLSLKRTNMAHAVLNCPQLHDLDIGSCHKLSDAGIRSAATSCPLLASLDMSNCSCVSDETLREIAHICVSLRVLNASNCPNISLESVRLPMLTVLKLNSCEGITSASMAAIAHSSVLEVLVLDNCSLLTSVLFRSSMLAGYQFNSLPQVQSIALVFLLVSNCPVLRINIMSNSIQSLTEVGFSSTSLVSLSLVGCCAMTALELKCPYLEHVYLDGCDHLERASFSPVGLQSLNLGICPKLNVLRIEAPHMVVLELKGCGVLSEASINCPLLTSLDASFCNQLKDDCLSATTSSCPLIESLILMSCPSVGPDGLSSLRLLSNLTLLDLSYTFLMNLQPVFESCFQLKVLKLQACKYLTDSSLEPLYKEGALPALRELDLSYGSLCQSAIEELLACCTHLTHVSLNGCVHMHDLNWSSRDGHNSEFPSIDGSSILSSHEIAHEPIEHPDRLLQNLNCVGCPNIKKVVILPMARCFYLSCFNLSLSANLREVYVASVNLSFLNLSNCCSLEILKLNCPRLTSLFLQVYVLPRPVEALDDGLRLTSCSIAHDALEAALAHCNVLETLDVRYCPKICSESMGRFREACPSLKRIFSSLSTS